MVILIEFGAATVEFDQSLSFGHYDVSTMKSAPDRYPLVPVLT
jgi:hypothetical protein